MGGAEAIFDWPATSAILRIAARRFVAALFVAAVGFEREVTGKAAGLRTHMLVALGSAAFVLAPLESGTTAGTIWLTSAVGVAVGLGQLWLPGIAVFLALTFLVLGRRLTSEDKLPGAAGSNR